MIQSTRFRLLSGQAGLALPIALIMLVAMIGSAAALHTLALPRGAKT